MRRTSGLEKPVEVGLAGGFRSQDEEFGDFVGVEIADCIFYLVETGCRGFDEEQDFNGSFDLSLPSIDGGEAGYDVDAGGEVVADEGAGDALGLLAGAGGGKDDAYIGGG